MALPLVLIPGLGCTGDLFLQQLPTLCANGFVAVAAQDIGESMDDVAIKLLEMLPERFCAVGFSMGGYVLQALLQHGGERVAQAAFLNTTVAPDSEEKLEMRRKKIARVEGGDYEHVVSEDWPNYVAPEFVSNPLLQSLYIKMAAETGAARYAHQQELILSRPDRRDMLQSYQGRVLVVGGQEDRVTTLEAAQEIADVFAHSTLKIFEGCGHFSPFEAPKDLTETLVDWWVGSA